MLYKISGLRRQWKVGTQLSLLLQMPSVFWVNSVFMVRAASNGWNYSLQWTCPVVFLFTFLCLTDRNWTFSNSPLTKRIFFSHFKIFLIFIYLFLVAAQGLSVVAGATLVAVHGASHCSGLSCCTAKGSRARGLQQLCYMGSRVQAQ